MIHSRRSRIRTLLIGLLSVTTTLVMTLPADGWAMLAPAEAAAPAAPGAQEKDLQTVRTALESKLLQQRLSELNLTSEQIDERLAQLSDEEIHQAALQLEAVQPGGDGLTYILLVAVLVLLVIYLAKRV